MAPAKIAFVTRLGPRTDLIKSLAPPDVEVTLVDLELPEEEKKAQSSFLKGGLGGFPQTAAPPTGVCS